MAAKYCTIAHGSGYLSAYTSTLDAGRRAAAEAEADALVDRLLDGFATDAWTPATTPAEIRQAADKFAAGRFLRLEASKLSTVHIHEAEGGGKTLPEKLEREAREDLEGIAARGWYRADDGSRVRRAEPGQAPFFAELSR